MRAIYNVHSCAVFYHRQLLFYHFHEIFFLNSSISTYKKKIYLKIKLLKKPADGCKILKRHARYFFFFVVETNREKNIRRRKRIFGKINKDQVCPNARMLLLLSSLQERIFEKFHHLCSCTFLLLLYCNIKFSFHRHWNLIVMDYQS